MRIKKRNLTVHTLEIDGVEVELEFEPSYEGHVMAERVGSTLVVGYLSYDRDCRDIDDYMGDCMGKLYSFHRNASKDDHHSGMAALGNTRDGDMDLDAVWDKHEDEAINQYLAAVRKEYKFVEVQEKLEDDQGNTVRSWEAALDSLREDARGARWDCVAYHKTMEAVLEEMWEKPAYFPGDPDAQLLSCYEHGGQMWSLSGGGMQCRWDTSNQAGVWVPDEYLRKELDDQAPKTAWAYIEQTNWVRGTGKKYQLKVVSWCEPGPHHIKEESVGFSDDIGELWKQRDAIVALMPAPTPKHLAWARNTQARIYAKQFLETYNDVINGNIYNTTLQLFDLDNDDESDPVWVARNDWEGCGGFVGDDHAMESLKGDLFDPEVARLKAEHHETT